ncbi:MAG: 16S rRNA (cytosine(1402)-N(4))-methyltransferase RsmH [Xanthomonadaceae bacterium]|nr:16S rRNA (cytosine(1402)-N(4))-methyltransferase RsmH [Xanthomonadaceae bacterium]
MTHVPVMQEAAVDALDVHLNGSYLDATFGRGGHAALILKRLGPDGLLIALDCDPDAIVFAETRFSGDSRLKPVHCNFSEIGACVRQYAPGGQVNDILLDLGVSSPQLDNAERGFSFRQDGPLDMRMDPSVGEPASGWLARVESDELVRVLKQYGEERYARRIALAVVEARSEQPILKTRQLAEIVQRAMPAGAVRPDRIHPATRTFQAIRIAVNAELEMLHAALEAAIGVLAPGGRLVVISFHSLEDRIVKQAIRAASKPPPANRRMPSAPGFIATLRPVGSLIRPTDEEAGRNPRARSARMRVAERIGTSPSGGQP